MPRPRGALGFALVVLLLGNLPGQMSGKYTLHPSGSGTRNFKSFPAAIYQLYVSGVDAPVTIEVAPGNYGPTGWSFVAILGASPKNTITFQSRTRHAAKLVSTKTSGFRIEQGFFPTPATSYVLDLGGSNVVAFLAVGYPWLIPLGGGCDMHVFPSVIVGVPVGGSTGPGNGRATVKLTIPHDVRLRGVGADLQWGVVDHAAKGIGVALSDLARITL